MTFLPPVKPSEIGQLLQQFDIGLYILHGNHFNFMAALPNKFFDFISAGLAVCIGPSPVMAEIVENYGFGVVSPTINPIDVANTLNELTNVKIDKMKLRSIKSRKIFNSDVEMAKFLEIYKLK